MKAKELVYDVFVGAKVKCAEPTCQNIVTNYAIRKDAEDRRVWCLTHAHRAEHR